MPRRIASYTHLVPDHDEARRFFVGGLGFELREDGDLGGAKRWVRIAPPGAETEILLARALGPEQTATIGRQGGGRVWLFLESLDFAADEARIIAAGGQFEAAPRQEAYGKVAVFRDPWRNRWDLIDYSSPDRSGTGLTRLRP